MCAVALRQSRSGVSRVHGAIKAAIPGYIEPCDPTLRERPPPGEDWVYEIKADGYRAQLHLHDGDAKVYSRTGLDWTEQFSSIAAGAHLLKANSAIIDGEAVVYAVAAYRISSSLGVSSGPSKASACAITPSISCTSTAMTCVASCTKNASGCYGGF
ncbi:MULTISPECIES: hypothetical protein [unclassified Bradyrhizobium]|uniref:ATP-dependent DNA ligase n=1 Tax=unclassified Bradyrhizobium TaxID=2631580 RepID=UPI002097D82C|nr:MULTISPECIES: hypothetical protein [unclassified Bradyrhizobium]